MRQIVAFVFYFFCLPIFSGHIPANAQDTLINQFEFDGEMRDYRLFLPQGHDASQPMPLIFNMHGFTSSAEDQEVISKMNLVADTAGFMVCYPNGIDRAWNVGWGFGSTADDLGFISAMIDTFVQKYGADPSRIYSTGFSNGGFMSHRLACELNDRIAAIASVSGGFAPDYIAECEPAKAVPVMQIHGTRDLIVPIGGSPTVTVPIADVIDFWVENNQCDPTFVETPLNDLDEDDGSTVVQRDWIDCEAPSRIRYFEIDRGGHTWPGNPGFFTNRDISASEQIWLFFKQFELNSNSTSTDEYLQRPFGVYPNPTADVLNFNQEVGSFRIFNTMGQLVKTGKQSASVEMGDLPKGIYYGSFEIDGVNYQSKILKN